MVRIRIVGTFAIVSLLVVGGLLGFVVFESKVVSATTLYVGGGGPGNHTSIQAAIDVAINGDTIFVYDESSPYYEKNLNIDKILNLTGENKDTTIVDGSGSFVFVVVADWVNITGFSITNGSCGIYLFMSSNNSVVNNSLSNNHEGIRLSSSSNNNITNNTFVNNGILMIGDQLSHYNSHSIPIGNTVNGKPLYYFKNCQGIDIDGVPVGQLILANCSDVDVRNVWIDNTDVGMEIAFSTNTIITNSSILSNKRYGINLQFSLNSSITGNNISSNSNGIYLYSSENNTINNNTALSNGLGIDLVRSNNNTVINNTALYNVEGITIRRSSYNTIANNNASFSNQHGMALYTNPNNNTISNNTFFSNAFFGVYSDFSNYNWIFHNNFTGNNNHAFDSTDTNHWDNGYPSGGNYWDDYSGVDLNNGPNQDILGSDGIGDTPYQIQGPGFNEDDYPLMFSGGTLGRPRNLEAILSGLSKNDVALSWDLSTNDGTAGNHVVRYDIFRNTSFYVPSGNGYQLIASIPNGTSSYTDSGKGEGNPEDYFYLVCAVNSWNNTACSNEQAAKFIRTLSEGLNLVSIPLSQSDESVEVVLQTLSFDKVWFYDSLNLRWKSYIESKPYIGELRHVNHTMGLWVNVTQDSNLTVAGVVPTSTTIDLQAGWNLVGFPSFDDNYTVADLKVAVTVERIEGFDGLAQPYFLRALTDGDFLQAGFGYWIKVGSETIWTVQNV